MYKIRLTKTALNQLRKIDSKSRKQIMNKIRDLATDPEKRGKALKGSLSEFRSIRATGQRYRIIYKIEDEIISVIVVAVGIRKEHDKKDIYTLMKKLINTNLLD